MRKMSILVQFVRLIIDFVFLLVSRKEDLEIVAERFTTSKLRKGGTLSTQHFKLTGRGQTHLSRGHPIDRNQR